MENAWTWQWVRYGGEWVIQRENEPLEYPEEVLNYLLNCLILYKREKIPESQEGVHLCERLEKKW